MGCLGSDERLFSTTETDERAAKQRKCGPFLPGAEMAHGDRIGWLMTQSIANRSLPKFPDNREKYREICENQTHSCIHTARDSSAVRAFSPNFPTEPRREFGHSKQGNRGSEQGRPLNARSPADIASGPVFGEPGTRLYHLRSKGRFTSDCVL